MEKEYSLSFYKQDHMQKNIYLVCLSIFMLGMHIGFSQTLKAGDKAEALVNKVWKEVRIVKAVAGKPNVYEVEITGRQGPAKNTLQVNKTDLRTVKQAVAATPPVTATAEKIKTADPHLGKYDLYSGIPSMYIGHLVLLTGGKYKVALSTDESNYETGDYTFDASTSTIEWKTGLFNNNNWKGKLVNTSGNNYRIEFNKVTFADSN